MEALDNVLAQSGLVAIGKAESPGAVAGPAENLIKTLDTLLANTFSGAVEEMKAAAKNKAQSGKKAPTAKRAPKAAIVKRPAKSQTKRTAKPPATKRPVKKVKKAHVLPPK
jgi:hypothetical protein